MDSNVINLRVFYEKLSRAKYISHLDITRCMQRAIKRAGIPVWYTEGFNPHIYITFALPLSLGYESYCEIMDMRLTQQMDFNVIKDKLNECLPCDIRVRDVALQIEKPEAIVNANYRVSLFSDKIAPQTVLDSFNEFFSNDKIEVMKKSKKGSKLVDIKPDCKVISLNLIENGIEINLDCTAGISKNVNPSLLIAEFKTRYNYSDLFMSVVKNAVYDSDGNLFC
ncbi:MAG: TIGR03936 family radical SAM-associated protein [Oscillospiraceae bacterium]